MENTKRGSLVVLDGSISRIRACVEYYRREGRAVLTPSGEHKSERQELNSHTFTLSAALGLVENGMDCVIAGLPASPLANQAMKMAFQRYSAFILGVDLGDIQSYPDVYEAAFSIARNITENHPSWALERTSSGVTGSVRPHLIVAGFDAVNYLPFHQIAGAGRLVHSGLHESHKRLGIALVDLHRCNPTTWNLLVEEGHRANSKMTRVIGIGSSVYLHGGGTAHASLVGPSSVLRTTKKKQSIWIEQLRDTIIKSLE